MEIEFGENKVVGMHKGCEHKGKIVKCLLMKIDGEYYPPGTKTVEWYWCNGKRWNPQERIWEHCKCSTLNGDTVEIDSV